MTLNQIIQAVSKEAAAFRRETKRLTPKQVYDKAYDIHLAEELVYLICECPGDYEDDDEICDVLSILCTDGRLISEYLKWVSSEDSVDMSNTGQSYNALADFCADYLKKPKEEATDK